MDTPGRSRHPVPHDPHRPLHPRRPLTQEIRPDSPSPGPVPHGPASSDASLRAALDHERAHANQLRQLSEHQRRLLRKKSVRLALSIDRRSQRAWQEVSRRAARLRRRAARARMAAVAWPTRSDRDRRRTELESVAAGLAPAPADDRSVSLIVIADGATSVPTTIDRRVDVTMVLTSHDLHAPEDFDGSVVRAGHKTVAAAARDAANRAGGDLLCITRSTSIPLQPSWLGHLTAAIADDAVAACPMLVHPERSIPFATPHDLRVRAVGLDIVDTGPSGLEVRAVGAGTAPRVDRTPAAVASGTSAGLVVRRDAYREAGGLGLIDDLDAAILDLCGRLHAGGGRVVAVPSAVLTDTRPVGSVAELARPIDNAGEAWHRVLRRQQTTMVQLATHQPVTEHLLVRITVAAPSLRVAHRWGDWHLAEGMAGGLRRLGHSVHLQTLGDVGGDERTGDVHLVLRGTAPVPRRGEAHRVLWVISHPEEVDISECDEADLVLVASEQFAATLRTQTSTPVEALLQATDHHRFAPRPPDHRHAHAVAVVAMTRHVFRPSVRYAVEAGFRPAIYGADWREFVDPDLIVAPFVHNHRLPVIYSSVGVLLNDHWDTMRRWGFVSNRLYDGLGCAAPIVSDHLPEIESLFGDAIATFTTPDELRGAVDEALDDPVEARARAEHGRQLVLAHHTFDHRAGELVTMLERHGLVRLR